MAAPTKPGKPLPPVIDEITVEKEDVCEGEENLITVKAHAQDDAAPLLRVVIGSQRGAISQFKRRSTPPISSRQKS